MIIRKKCLLILLLSIVIIRHVNAFTVGCIVGNFYTTQPVEGGVLMLWNSNCWKQSAPVKYRKFDYKKPPKKLFAQILARRDMFNLSEFVFEVPLPDALKEYYFYHISSDGIQPLTIVSMYSTVTFSLVPDKDTLKGPPLYSGFIIAKADSGGLPKTGFAIRSKTPLSFTISNYVFNILDFPGIMGACREEIVKDMKEGENWKVKKCYKFSTYNNDSTYGYVEWDATDINCYFQGSIFFLGKPEHEIISFTDGCDL